MRVSVLLCGDRMPEIVPDDWERCTALSQVELDLQVVPGLCRKPRSIVQTAKRPERLVVGVCPGEHSVGAIQAQARRLGLDALGVELVDVSDAAGDPARSSLLVAASVARACAFGGSTPAHAKITLPRAVSRRSLFSFSEHAYAAVPDVDQGTCAAGVGCHACVDTCPQGALTWSRGVVTHDASSCEPCGLCVTACPTSSLRNPAVTPLQLRAQMSALLDSGVGPPEERGIVWRCSRATRPETDPGWCPVDVPCTGMLRPDWLLAPLLLGAGAVAIRPCGDSGCPLGNDARVERTLAFCRDFLAEVGLPPELVRSRTDSAPGGALDLAPVENIFEAGSASAVLLSLAETTAAPATVRVDHPASPVGLVHIGTASCTACTMCAQSCPTGALAFETAGEDLTVSFDASLCSACAQCLPRCPEFAGGAIRLERVSDVAVMQSGRRILFREEVSRCVRCGEVIAPKRLLARFSGMLGPEGDRVMQTVSSYCVDCRGLTTPTPAD